MRYAIVLALVAGFLPVAALADEATQKLFEDKCSLCHKAGKVEKVSLDAKGWTDLVSRMQKKSAGAISEAEAVKIADYLANSRTSSK